MTSLIEAFGWVGGFLLANRRILQEGLRVKLPPTHLFEATHCLALLNVKQEGCK